MAETTAVQAPDGTWTLTITCTENDAISLIDELATGADALSVTGQGGPFLLRLSDDLYVATGLIQPSGSAT